LFYITSLEKGSKAEKFLLWPLFITGSECVNKLQQNIVRGKCRELMGRSGYLNNLAGLEVLEKLWGENEEGRGEGEMARGMGTGTGMGIGVGVGAFRWTKFMEGSEREWIMV
jgi:hypothetical protein